MTDLEAHVFAFYVADSADTLNMVGRFWPRPELGRIVEDKMQIAVRRFGPEAVAAAKVAGEAFADKLLETGAFSTQANKFGGTMHQFQPDRYVVVLAELRAADPIVQAAQDKDAAFWDGAFATAQAA